MLHSPSEDFHVDFILKNLSDFLILCTYLLMIGEVIHKLNLTGQ